MMRGILWSYRSAIAHPITISLLARSARIVACAKRENRVVVTKDGDFVQSFLLTGYPTLLLISTGNITNAELQKLLHANLREIELAFAEYRFVEITREDLVIHE